MNQHSDAELYQRGAATLLASWREYARGSTDAKLERLPGVAAAVFPHEPERSVYNNALLETGLSSHERSEAIAAMEDAYAAAAVDRFAAWVRERDHLMRGHLERRGYRAHTSTRAMGLDLDGARLPQTEIALAPEDWHEHLRIAELPPNFLANADPTAYRVALGRLNGESVATAMALERDGDCGIYNVGTLARARRQGLGTGVTVALLRGALQNGCVTASLQATPMAERLYASLGFRDLSRIVEYVPPR